MNFEEYGFKYPNNLIMKYIGGSQAHGAKLGATDDTDWYGVFIEPIECVFGLENYPHFVYTTGGRPGGNGPEDIDVTLYSLRKWAGLTAKGNPSALHFLFAPGVIQDNFLWQSILESRNVFLARSHVKGFVGFAHDQMKRLLGEKGQKNVHRKEIEDKFGFDTKYAMHVIRLYSEAYELMTEGYITLPRPEKGLLIDIRAGKYTLSQITELANQLHDACFQAEKKSYLPEHVRREDVSALITRVQRIFHDLKELEGSANYFLN